MSSSIISDDPSSDNPLVDDATDSRQQYDMLQSTEGAVAGFAVLAGGLNPATIAIGAANGQFDNMDSAYNLTQGTSLSTVVDAATQMKEGDWASAAASLGMVGADVLGAVTDPIAAVAGQLIGWMLEHVEPLRMVLHQLTGNPDMVAGYANTWSNVGSHVAEQGVQVVEDFKNGTTDWQGEAKGACAERMVACVQQMAAATQAADAISKAAMKLKDVVNSVRAYVRDILADLAGGLVSAAIQAATVVLAPGAVKTILMKISKAGIDIAEGVAELTVVITRFNNVVVDLMQSLDEVERAYEKTS
ncbi:hypothetical protein [Prauserella alba]|uniref:Uncharacterized protein n=1 Tax=Prauserella alba TaxID=176898 RepID=A0ABP4G4L9_9PSEU|nr:hypothetical protein [Prauserella alba]MCP2182033.1 hypothetical protein [Prauserella alba]